jgi:hypothetical protein
MEFYLPFTHNPRYKPALLNITVRNRPILIGKDCNILYSISQSGTCPTHYQGHKPTLKKILEREDQYLYVARRTFTNLSLRVPNLHRAVSNLSNEILPKKADISLLKISICFLA